MTLDPPHRAARRGRRRSVRARASRRRVAAHRTRRQGRQARGRQQGQGTPDVQDRRALAARARLGSRGRHSSERASQAGRVQGRLLGRLELVRQRPVEGLPQRLQADARRAHLARDRVPGSRRVVLGAPELAARPPGLRRAVDGPAATTGSSGSLTGPASCRSSRSGSGGPTGASTRSTGATPGAGKASTDSPRHPAGTRSTRSGATSTSTRSTPRTGRAGTARTAS